MEERLTGSGKIVNLVTIVTPSTTDCHSILSGERSPSDSAVSDSGKPLAQNNAIFWVKSLRAD